MVRWKLLVLVLIFLSFIPLVQSKGLAWNEDWDTQCYENPFFQDCMNTWTISCTSITGGTDTDFCVDTNSTANASVEGDYWDDVWVNETGDIMTGDLNTTASINVFSADNYVNISRHGNINISDNIRVAGNQVNALILSDDISKEGLTSTIGIGIEGPGQIVRIGAGYPGGGMAIGTRYITERVTIVGNVSITSGSNFVNVSATGDINMTGNLDVNSDGVAEGTVSIDGASGSNRSLMMTTGGSPRWALRIDDEAEGGADSGSNLQLVSYDDNGDVISTVFLISRDERKDILWYKIIDMNTNYMKNIGSYGTDFTPTGGLTLADDLVIMEGAGYVNLTADTGDIDAAGNVTADSFLGQLYWHNITGVPSMIGGNYTNKSDYLGGNLPSHFLDNTDTDTNITCRDYNCSTIVYTTNTTWNTTYSSPEILYRTNQSDLNYTSRAGQLFAESNYTNQSAYLATHLGSWYIGRTGGDIHNSNLDVYSGSSSMNISHLILRGISTGSGQFYIGTAGNMALNKADSSTSGDLLVSNAVEVYSGAGYVNITASTGAINMTGDLMVLGANQNATFHVDSAGGQVCVGCAGQVDSEARFEINASGSGHEEALRIEQFNGKQYWDVYPAAGNLYFYRQTGGTMVTMGYQKTEFTGTVNATTNIQADERFFAPMHGQGNPTYSFTNETDTGMYSQGNGILNFATNGARRFYMTTSLVTSILPIAAVGNNGYIETRDNWNASQSIRIWNLNEPNYIDYKGGDLNFRDEGSTTTVVIESGNKGGLNVTQNITATYGYFHGANVNESFGISAKAPTSILFSAVPKGAVHGYNTESDNYGILGYERNAIGALTYGVYGHQGAGEYAIYSEGDTHITNDLTVGVSITQQGCPESNWTRTGLGCVQNGEHGSTARISEANDACYTNYSARLPWSAELASAFKRVGTNIKDKTDDDEWVLDVGVITIVDSCAALNADDGDFDMHDRTDVLCEAAAAVAYRCWIPFGGG